jgi:uncharacterized protein YjhX (UPF0386 family)
MTTGQRTAAHLAQTGRRCLTRRQARRVMKKHRHQREARWAMQTKA